MFIVGNVWAGDQGLSAYTKTIHTYNLQKGKEYIKDWFKQFSPDSVYLYEIFGFSDSDHPLFWVDYDSDNENSDYTLYFTNVEDYEYARNRQTDKTKM